MNADVTNDRGLMRVLRIACDSSAGLGCTVLLMLALLTVVSVIGRALFSHPIQGDVELVQLGVAVCIASFLPYTQFKRGNIIVDFFTVGVSARKRCVLDGLGALLYAVTMALICWRAAVGGLQVYADQETSALMAIPIWIPYLLMLPGLAIAAVVGAVHTVEHLRAAMAPAEEAA